MRTDRPIDRQAVKLPHIGTLGYSKNVARVGYMIEFSEGPSVRIGRMIGRVRMEDGKYYLVIVALAGRMNRLCERWVNPCDVIDAWDISEDESLNPLPTIQSLLSANIVRPSMLDKARRAANELWSSLDAFLSWEKSR